MKPKFTTRNYNAPLYPMILIAETMMRNFPKKFGKDWNTDVVGKWENGINDWLIFDEKADENAPYFQEKVLNSNFLDIVERQIEKSGKNLLQFSRKFQVLKSTRKTDQELAKLYSEFNKKYKDLYTWGFALNAVDGRKNSFSQGLENELKKILKEKGKEERFGKYYEILSSFNRLSLREKARIELLEIFLTGVTGNLKKYAGKYSWLTFNYCGPIYSLEDARKDLKEILSKKDAKKELDSIKEKRLNLQRLRKKIFKELKFSPELRKKFNALAKLYFLKDHRKNILYQANFHISFLLKEISKRFDISLKRLYYAMPNEICLLLSHKLNQDILDAELILREEFLFITFEHAKSKIFSGKKAKEMFKKYKQNEIIIENEKKLTGQIACAGKCKGRAKIVNFTSELSKVNKGDILVSVKTDPTLLPAMKQAGAIIAEMGGITSHAAIVARELRKPCIIGVKNATIILKDGDKIFVDANKGEIMILK